MNNGECEMSKYILEDSDIGEMLVLAANALKSCQKQVAIDTDDAVQVLEAASSSFTMAEQLRIKEQENAELRDELQAKTDLLAVMVNGNAELREALRDNELLITHLTENLAIKEFEKVENKIIEVSLNNLKLLNK